MVNAGRILILAKGEWDSLVTYEQLDLISYNGVAYLARQASVGVNPSTDTTMTYWQPFGTVSDIATTTTPGLVMPDGTTITIDQTGLIQASLGISDINDVVLTSIANGDILQYDSGSQKWVNVGMSSFTQGIQAMIATLENGSTTSQAYAIGEHFIRNGNLYKAKVAIAQGTNFSSLVVGTDYEAETTPVEKQLEGKINTSDIANNLTTATSGKVLDASQGKILNDAITNKVLYFTGVACSATTGDFTSYSNNAITADHVVTECVFADPSAITTDVTWTTAAGNVKLNGTCASATTVNLVLVKKDN